MKHFVFPLCYMPACPPNPGTARSSWPSTCSLSGAPGRADLRLGGAASPHQLGGGDRATHLRRPAVSEASAQTHAGHNVQVNNRAAARCTTSQEGTQTLIKHVIRLNYKVIT